MTISNLLLVSGLLTLGLAVWSFGEYVLHRFLMHEMKGRGITSREHLLHHADPERNGGRPVLSWIGIAVVGAVLFLAPGLLLFGYSTGWATYAGWLLGYGIYQQIHNRAHSHGPRTVYGVWVRRNHFFHHHGHPMLNHGVTSPVWDKVFGTYAEAGRLRIPRRHAPIWLLDDDGKVRPEHAAYYVVVGSADPSDRMAAIDRARAFANLTLVAR